MAGEDKFENELISQPSIDVETDYIRTLDSTGVSYKTDFADVAAALIERYEGSELGGRGEEYKKSIQQAFADMAGDIAGLADDISGINDRICTSAELTALEQRLGL